MWPGIGHSVEVTNQIAEILRKDYKLEDRVQIFSAIPDKIFEQQQKAKKIEKGPLRPIVTGFFGDGDPRIEGGLPEYEELNGHYLAVVQHMFQPGSGLSINDLLMYTMALFYAVNDYSKPLRKALISPYMPYLRAHSVDKYLQRGFGEADRMKMLSDILALCQLDDVFIIHPHSEKIGDYLSARGITPHLKETFRNYKYIDFRKLGFESRDESQAMLERQQPIVNEIKYLNLEAAQKQKNMYVIVPDEGAEHLVETLARDADIDYDRVGNILKERLEAGEVRIIGFKDFCNINHKEMEGSICAVCDDMTSSGDTLEKIAKFLKEEYKVSKVVGFVSHAAVDNKSKIEQLHYLDELVYTDTILHTNLPHTRVVVCSADIIAASLCRSYRRELAKLRESL